MTYSPVTDETMQALWPESETRPKAAWTHSLCGLVVTNRANHNARGGEFECPAQRRQPLRARAQKVREGN